MAQKRGILGSTFPDIREYTGRAGGVLLGLKTAQERGDINRKFGQTERALNIRESSAAARLNISDKKTYLNLYNKELKRVGKRNEEGRKEVAEDTYYDAATKQWIKPGGEFIPETAPTLNEFLQRIGVAEAEPAGGADLLRTKTETKTWPGGAPSPYDTGERTLPKSPTMPTAPPTVGGQGFMQRMGGNLRQMGGNIQQVLQSLIGAPQSSAPPQSTAGAGVSPTAGTTPGAGGLDSITTEDLLATLEEYDDAESAIEDILALDNMFNQEGLELGLDVDVQSILDAFRQKFGEDAVQRLMARVQ